jgi:hypothetical protein
VAKGIKEKGKLVTWVSESDVSLCVYEEMVDRVEVIAQIVV